MWLCTEIFFLNSYYLEDKVPTLFSLLVTKWLDWYCDWLVTGDWYWQQVLSTGSLPRPGRGDETSVLTEMGQYSNSNSNHYDSTSNHSNVHSPPTISAIKTSNTVASAANFIQDQENINLSGESAILRSFDFLSSVKTNCFVK